MFGFGVRLDNKVTPSFYAPPSAMGRFACGWYGVGHTARRRPGGPRSERSEGFDIRETRKEVMYKPKETEE